MNRVQGSMDIPLILCINPYIKKYRLRWDIKPVENQEGIVSFYETDVIVKYKLRLFDIKNTILDTINKEIDKKILSDFVWKDMSVWLSTENQFNYKAAYDLAVMSQGKSLPILFKFGSTDSPVYYTFETIEDISDFYLSAMAFINKTLKEGWEMKDSIDWSIYEEVLKKL